MNPWSDPFGWPDATPAVRQRAREFMAAHGIPPFTENRLDVLRLAASAGLIGSTFYDDEEHFFEFDS